MDSNLGGKQRGGPAGPSPSPSPAAYIRGGEGGVRHTLELPPQDPSRTTSTSTLKP